MSRKELYAKVKENHLEDAIKKKFGDNFTRVSSASLEAFVKEFESSKKVAAPKPKPVTESKKEEVKEEAKTKDNYTPKTVTNLSGDKFDKLVQLLVKKHLLLASEVDAIYGK